MIFSLHISIEYDSPAFHQQISYSCMTVDISKIGAKTFALAHTKQDLHFLEIIRSMHWIISDNRNQILDQPSEHCIPCYIHISTQHIGTLFFGALYGMINVQNWYFMSRNVISFMANSIMANIVYAHHFWHVKLF